jgi:small subunit ribosomal protein S6e
MAIFRFVIGHAGRTVQIEKDQKDAPVFGKKIGDAFTGEFLGLDGYELKVTGGSDKDGFPMRSDVEGIVKKHMILTKGVGFRSMKRIKKKKFKREGLRKRKTIRGNTISGDTMQINCVITKTGSKNFDELFPKKPKEAKSEEKKE